jgi:hypothetical protein
MSIDKMKRNEYVYIYIYIHRSREHSVIEIGFSLYRKEKERGKNQVNNKRMK